MDAWPTMLASKETFIGGLILTLKSLYPMIGFGI